MSFKYKYDRNKIQYYNVKELFGGVVDPNVTKDDYNDEYDMDVQYQVNEPEVNPSNPYYHNVPQLPDEAKQEKLYMVNIGTKGYAPLPSPTTGQAYIAETSKADVNYCADDIHELITKPSLHKDNNGNTIARNNVVRFVSYNVHNFVKQCNPNTINQHPVGRNISPYLDFLHNLDADIVFLQEIVPYTLPITMDKYRPAKDVAGVITDKETANANFTYIVEAFKKIDFIYHYIADTHYIKLNITKIKVSGDTIPNPSSKELPKSSTAPFWTCSACTFDNASTNQICAICEGNRPAGVVDAPPKLNETSNEYNETSNELKYNETYALDANIPYFMLCNSIMSKYPILSKKTFKLGNNRICMMAIILKENKLCVCFNVHIEIRSDRDTNNNQYKTIQMNTLAKIIYQQSQLIEGDAMYNKYDIYYVLGGDFNNPYINSKGKDPLFNPIVRAMGEPLTANMLGDPPPHVDPKYKNTLISGQNQMAQIDYFFVSRPEEHNKKPYNYNRDYNIVRNSSSDHYPIVYDLYDKLQQPSIPT